MCVTNRAPVAAKKRRGHARGPRSAVDGQLVVFRRDALFVCARQSAACSFIEYCKEKGYFKGLTPGTPQCVRFGVLSVACGVCARVCVGLPQHAPDARGIAGMISGSSRCACSTSSTKPPGASPTVRSADPRAWPRRGRARFAAFVDARLSTVHLSAPQELGASQELQDKFIRMLRDKGFFQASRRVTVWCPHNALASVPPRVCAQSRQQPLARTSIFVLVALGPAGAWQGPNGPLEEGSAEYTERHNKAVEKFQQKMGGTASRSTPAETSPPESAAELDARADACKARGNDFLTKRMYREAICEYTRALEACVACCCRSLRCTACRPIASRCTALGGIRCDGPPHHAARRRPDAVCSATRHAAPELVAHSGSAVHGTGSAHRSIERALSGSGRSAGGSAHSVTSA